MLYTINFSIETKPNQLQKVCDELHIVQID